MALICDICGRTDTIFPLVGDDAWCSYDQKFRKLTAGTVGDIDPTVTLAIADTTVTAAQNVAMTATITAPTRMAGASIPNGAGAVEFFADATSLGTGSVTNGVATKSDSTPAAGTYDYTAVWTDATGVYATTTSNAVEVVISA